MANRTHKIHAHLSRQASGDYMLTYDPPVLAEVGATKEKDWYVSPGDGVGFRHICPWAAKVIWGAELERLQTVRVTFSGEVLEVPSDE